MNGKYPPDLHMGSPFPDDAFETVACGQLGTMSDLSALLLSCHTIDVEPDVLT